MPRSSVCLIEDDPLVRDALAFVLGDNGFDVVTAAAPGGLGAHASAPDCIVLDLGAAGASGLMQLRLRFPHTPIIVVSGQEAAALERAREAGADACVRKPFKPRDLIQTIEAARRGRARGAV